MKKIAYIAVVALAIVACNKEEGAKTLTVTPAEKTVFTDEDLPELSVSATPENALDGVTVEWTSSDPELVTVSPKGELALTVEDIEEKEKVVTITAKAGELSATCKLTIKGQIARYEVLDFTKDFGFKMLDRNIGAKSKEDAGYFYQWGKILPVASGNDTKVNEFYDKDWSPESKGFADWTVAENTPCPKGWSLPNDEQMKKVKAKLDIIGDWYFEMATDEDCAEAFAIVDKMALVECGQFKKESTTQKYLPTAKYFWTSYTFKDDADVSKVGTFEYNNFPTYNTKAGGSYDLAIPVRCVK